MAHGYAQSLRYGSGTWLRPDPARASGLLSPVLKSLAAASVSLPVRLGRDWALCPHLLAALPSLRKAIRVPACFAVLPFWTAFSRPFFLHWPARNDRAHLPRALLFHKGVPYRSGPSNLLVATPERG